MVYNADGHLRGRAKKNGLWHTVTCRRLYNSPFFAQGGKYKGSLCCRSRTRRQVDEESRSQKTSEQGRLDRDNSDLAPWSEVRQCENEVLHIRTRCSEDYALVKGFAPRRPSRSEIGPGEEADSLLWGLCVAHIGYATGAILHMLSVLGHGSGEDSRRTRTCSSLTPKYPRPPEVARSLTTRTLRSPGGSTPPQAAIHSDAADMGYGATIRFDNLQHGIDGQWHAKGIWDWRDHAHSISYRELKAIRKPLTGYLGHKLEQESVQSLLLHVDNQAVFHITKALVSANRPMMREPRKLKLCRDRLGLQIRSEWIRSAACLPMAFRDSFHAAIYRF